MERQVKSKQRVTNHGEVFTAEREVKAMCDLVIDATSRIDSRFFEPACGDGNFLIEILSRKLGEVKKIYRKSVYDYETYSLLALGSLYGVELLEDNVVLCRKRLLDYWKKEYKLVSKREYDEKVEKAAEFIIKRNIVCGNALTLKCVDENGNDVEEPIVFSEWSFPMNGIRIKRKDYTLDKLVNRPDEDDEIDEEGEFLKEYTIYYKKLFEGGDC